MVRVCVNIRLAFFDCLLNFTFVHTSSNSENSPPIEGAKDIGYSHSHGPQLFDEIAYEMAEEALEISSASARQLSNALALGFKDFEKESSCDSSSDDSIVSTLKEVHPLMSMPITNELANDNEVVASRVSLDRSTGICPVTHAHQRLIVLEPDQRKQLHGDLLKLSIEQFASYVNRKKGEDPERARKELQAFSDWLGKWNCLGRCLDVH